MAAVAGAVATIITLAIVLAAIAAIVTKAIVAVAIAAIATKAIVAVEVFGNTTHMLELERIAQRHEVALVEDCCEALGGVTACGRRAGSFGRASVFGFYPNKQITTGEGGMIVTDDHALADRCRSLRNQVIPALAEAGYTLQGAEAIAQQ